MWGRHCCPGTTCKCDYMTTAVDDLVSLFAAKLQMDGTRVSPVAQGSRELRVEYRGDHLTLVLPKASCPRCWPRATSLHETSGTRLSPLRRPPRG